MNLNFSCGGRRNFDSCCDDNCDDKTNVIVGEGELVEQEISLDSFSKIGLIGQSNIFITRGDTQVIKIRAQQNILDVMTHKVSKGEFIVGFESKYKIKTDKDVFVDIITPSIISDISISGAGNIHMYKDCQKSFNIDIFGAGKVDSFDLITDNCNVIINGTGNCNVFVNKNLNIKINGAGKISYKGSPKIIQKITGSGKISNAN